MNLLIKGGRVVDPSQGLDATMDILIENGKISKIGREQTDGDNFAVGVAKEETPVLITGANRQDGLYWRISRLDFEVLF